MRVAVAPELDEVTRRLRAVGDQVVLLTRPDRAANADVVVVTGLSQDLLGDETVRVRGQVVNADGQTADEIVRRIDALRPRPDLG